MDENWLKSNNIGFIDERCETTHDYSLINSTKTFDVKTKDRTVPFKSSYECTVPIYNHQHQKPTYYIFVSLERSKDNQKLDISRFHTAYIVGGLNQKQLEKFARKLHAGDIDTLNGMEVKMDCLNVYGHQVTAPQEVIKKWKEINGAVEIPL